jgi:nitrogen regulatory protein PII
MKQVTAIIKPFRLNEVRDALNAIGVSGVTVTQVQGYGRQRGQGAVYRGPEYEVKFIPKLKVEVLVVADHAEKGVRDDLEGGSNGAAWGRQGFHSGHKESRAYSHRRVGSRSQMRKVWLVEDVANLEECALEAMAPERREALHSSDQIGR